jgi:hypothetical protein
VIERDLSRQGGMVVHDALETAYRIEKLTRTSLDDLFRHFDVGVRRRRVACG